MYVLTEAELRAAHFSVDKREYHVPQDTFVTPMAKEYLRDRGIRLVMDGGETVAMTRTEIKKRGEATYINAETGETYREKPEELTHLRGNRLISKTHPRIALRGQLDFLQAQILLLQVQCEEEEKLCRDLDEVLEFVRTVLGAEVKEEKLGEQTLFGYGYSELRRISHHIKEELGLDHPIPSRRMGETALRLNLLRTQVRQAELLAVRAFSGEDSLGIIQGLNRLSSAVYILFCRRVSGFYANGREER